jgi:hypothetical protein
MTQTTTTDELRALRTLDRLSSPGQPVVSDRQVAGALGWTTERARLALMLSAAKGTLEYWDETDRDTPECRFGRAAGR